MVIDEFLKIAIERDASDVHLKAGNHPMIRVHGTLTPLTGFPRLTTQDTEELGEPDDDGLPEEAPHRRTWTSTWPTACRDSAVSGEASSTSAARWPSPSGSSRSRSRPSASSSCPRSWKRSPSISAASSWSPGRPGAARRRRWPPCSTTSTPTAGRTSSPSRTRSSTSTRTRRAPSARGRSGMDVIVVRAGPARLPPRGPRRHPGGRDARPGHHRDGPPGRRDGPPRLQHPPHPGRSREHQPHHLGLRPPPPAPGPAPAGQHPEGDHLDAADPADGRPGPGPGRRGHDLHALHRGVHRGPGKDDPHPGRDRVRRLPIRHADVRPVDLPALPGRLHLLRAGHEVLVQPGQLQAPGHGHPIDPGHRPGGDGKADEQGRTRGGEDRKKRLDDIAARSAKPSSSTSPAGATRSSRARRSFPRTTRRSCSPTRG